MEALLSTIEQIWCGDFQPAEALEQESQEPWLSHAFNAHRFLAGLVPSNVTQAELDATPAPTSASGFFACAAASAAVGKSAIITFDRETLSSTVSRLEVHLEGWTTDTDMKPRALAWLESLRAWAMLLQDHDPSALLETLSKEAKQLGEAPLVIELAVLRALTAERLGHWDEAREHARRASRMGRTESFPQQEYLANLVLARIRRVNGVSHYGIRILSALKRVMPPAWNTWLRWEARLAGADIAAGDDVASLIDQLIVAAEQGDRPRFDHIASDCAQRLAGFPLIQRDSIALRSMLDPFAPVADSPDWLSAFLNGSVDDSAFGLASTTGKDAKSESNPGTCWLLVSPDRRSRRFLHPGLGFLAEHPQLGETHRRQSRLRSATCALALSPQGLKDPQLFERVFGFPFEHEEHHGVLRVTLHRLRKQLADFAEIVPSEDAKHLRPVTTFVVADPYATSSPADRILKWVGGRPGGSAKDAARALGMNLRTVQHELQQLVEDGVCSAQRDGRALSYWIEDTTFREPTRVTTG